MSRRATCLNCLYKRRYRVVEIEWELLARCPKCGAYDWEPKPIVRAVVGLIEEEKETT